MENHRTLITGTNKVEQFHREAQIWISSAYFIKDEVIFIEKLLRSYVFEPDTPNLFERLQDYLQRLESNKSRLDELVNQLIGYETELGGLLECQAFDDLAELEKRHLQMKSQGEEFQLKFKMLKSEIFNYAGGILRKRKK